MKKPRDWEVFCKRCYVGWSIADAVVRETVSDENRWPKHCGAIMSLRDRVVPKKVAYCSDMGCRRAENRVCSCQCEGRFHGADNYQRTYTSVKFTPQWWQIPARFPLPEKQKQINWAI